MTIDTTSLAIGALICAVIVAVVKYLNAKSALDVNRAFQSRVTDEEIKETKKEIERLVNETTNDTASWIERKKKYAEKYHGTPGSSTPNKPEGQS